MTCLYARRAPKFIDLDLASLKEAGSGNERRCYIDPQKPQLLYKISLPGRSLQTRREIAYFNFLKSRGVPFTHLPEYYGAFTCAAGLGIKQEHLLTDAEHEILGLEQALRDEAICVRWELAARLQPAFTQIEQYLLDWNVLPSDMLVHNLLIARRRTDGALKLYLIDGFGSHLAIPLNNFIRRLGARTIRHQCRKFALSVTACSQGRVKLIP